MTERQSSPAAARNRGPILEVLRGVLPPKARVLELASGSGEHGVYFAQAMPGWEWQPSDPDATARASISAWIYEAALTNVRAPMEIDARDEQWPVIGSFDAFVAINMIHISPWEATLGLMRGASRMLVAKGVLFTYGPYKRDGRHTAPSNEAFDVSLKTRNPAWGVRDVGEVEAAAHAQGLVLSELVEMPANNLSLVFARNS
jgi:cyclopropane fatty-acyl-phospholipid synthase-like methyltransferase